jgi:hypothetical protein
MKRFLSISVIAVALFVGAVGVAPAVHAQTQTATTSANTSVQNQTVAPVDNPKSLTLEDGGVFSKVMVFLMGIFAWLVGVAVLTLDYAVYYTVITMGNYIHNLSAVGVAWRILRDLGNILLIFGFLAIGISVILDTNLYGYGTKMLPTLLVAAVLLNFSLFMTEAVIDVGNLFATQFYTQINGGSLPKVAPSGLLTTASGVPLTPGNEGISQKIMSQLGLMTVYSDALNNNAVLKAGNTTLIGFMSIILFIITAFVLFSLAFILIARFVFLIFLIILAPIGFVGYAVPKLGGLSKQWTDKLVEQTITAPVLLFLLYVALVVITDANFLGFGPNRDWSGFVDTNGSMNLTGFASQILSFLVAMGILLMVVVYSKKLGAVGAAGATKWGGKLTFGATALAMRSTVGSGSQRLSRAIRASKFGGTKTGRLFAGVADRGAKGSFDIRGTSALKSFPMGGIDAGAAQKGGYRAGQEASVKGHQGYIKSVGEAIDERGEIKKDTVKMEETKKKAQEAHEVAKNEYDSVAQQVKQQEAEVSRLEAEKARNDKFSVRDPETEQKLEAARQNLKTSKENLTPAKEKFDKAEKEFGNAEKQTSEDVAKARMKDEKKTAQTAYAENIKGIRSWAMFGSGGPIAAKKIIKDATKKETEGEKMLKTLENAYKKSQEEKAKEDAGGTTNAEGAEKPDKAA